MKKFRKLLRGYLHELAAWYALKRGVRQRFSNLGYIYGTIHLMPQDEPERLYFQLYDAIVEGVDLSGKNVFEPSCGRGGGAYFLKEYCNAAAVTGTDQSRYNIEIAKQQSTVEGITFICQRVEEMNFPPESFGAVVNLEASNGYVDRKKFGKDVYNVLKPGGYFIYADIFKASAIPQVKDYLTGLGFAMVRETDLTRGVLLSIKGRAAHHHSFLKNLINKLVLTFYYTPESEGFKLMEQGEQKYVSFVYRKD